MATVPYPPLIRQSLQRHIKSIHHHHVKPNVARRHYREYKDMLEENPKGRGFIVKLANKYLLSPTNMAKIILNEYYLEEFNHKVNSKHMNKIIIENKDIGNARLTFEIKMCIYADTNFGLVSDCIKRTTGLEFEQILLGKVKENNLVFLDEDEMREQGYDKTPDIKLEVPVEINGFVVNWIESKALFGDIKSHSEYLENQYWCYWNRFGPGLVIYWMGYVAEIDTLSSRGIQVSDTLPPVSHMHPMASLADHNPFPGVSVPFSRKHIESMRPRNIVLEPRVDDNAVKDLYVIKPGEIPDWTILPEEPFALSTETEISLLSNNTKSISLEEQVKICLNKDKLYRRILGDKYEDALKIGGFE